MVSDPGCRFVRTEQNLLRRELVLSSLQVLGVRSVLFFIAVLNSPSFIHLAIFILQGIIIRSKINAEEEPC